MTVAAADFLGRGLLVPFRRAGSDFVNGGGADLVQAAVENILGTRAAGPDGSGGEVPWRLNFGSRLHLVRHRNLGPTTDELARYWIEDALARWEPRVVVRRVEVHDDPTTNARRLIIRYRLISSDVPDNLVSRPEGEAEVIV